MVNKLANNKWYLGFFYFYLIFMLLGCNLVEGIFFYKEKQSPPKFMSYYAKVCRPGSFPNNPKVYPIKLFPIYALPSSSKFGSSDLSDLYDLVQKKVCYDLSLQDDPEKNLSTYLVTYTFSESNARQIVESLQGESVQGIIGKPIIIQNPPLSQSIVASKAKLSPTHLKDLMELAEKNTYGYELKIVVPTYVPDGFKIDKLDIELKFGKGGRPNYHIIYKNKSNQYFEVSGSRGGLGGDPSGTRVIKVFSPALGNLSVLYTEFSQLSNGSNIVFEPTMDLIGGHFYYQFSSQGSNAISIKEALKIIQSLEYLNPY